MQPPVVNNSKKTQLDALQSLFEWGLSHGLVTNKIGIKVRVNSFGKEYVHLCASEQIQKEDVLLKIPSEFILKPSNVHKIDCLASIVEEHQQLFSTVDRYNNQCNLMILLVLYELNKAEKSEFSSYFDMVFLSNDLEFWEEANLEHIKDPFLSNYIREEISKNNKLYLKFKEIALENPKIIGDVTLQKFRKIALLVESRYFSDDLNELALIPFFDLMNHSNSPNVSFKMERKESSKTDLQRSHFGSLDVIDISIVEEEDESTPHRGHQLCYHKFTHNKSLNLSDSNHTEEANDSFSFDQNDCIKTRCSTIENEKWDLIVHSDSSLEINKGEELLISYGKRSNFFLMTWYGFSIRSNIYDNFRFYFDLPSLLSSITEGCKDLNQFLVFCHKQNFPLFKIKLGKLNIEFLDLLRSVSMKNFSNQISREHAIVSAYQNLLLNLLEKLTSKRTTPCNDFQRYAQIYDEEMTKIIEKQLEIVSHLLNCLKELTKAKKPSCHWQQNLKKNLKKDKVSGSFGIDAEVKEYLEAVLNPLFEVVSMLH